MSHVAMEQKVSADGRTVSVAYVGVRMWPDFKGTHVTTAAAMAEFMRRARARVRSLDIKESERGVLASYLYINVRVGTNKQSGERETYYMFGVPRSSVTGYAEVFQDITNLLLTMDVKCDQRPCQYTVRFPVIQMDQGFSAIAPPTDDDIDQMIELFKPR